MTSDFDWVTAFSSCSLPEVFERLRSQIRNDVETRQRLRPENAPYDFRQISNGKEFSVLIESNRVCRRVTFTLMDQGISVSDENDTPMFKATVTINDEGRCVVKIKNQEHELWQMRKMALEQLFFESLP